MVTAMCESRNGATAHRMCCNYGHCRSTRLLFVVCRSVYEVHHVFSSSVQFPKVPFELRADSLVRDRQSKQLHNLIVTVTVGFTTSVLN
jgi:hypothetical protein